jgi:flagellar protein FliJ
MAQPKFIFRLEALLEHRRQIEKEHQRRVAGIQQEIQKLVNEIRQAEERISSENRALAAEKLVGKLDMQYISHEKRFVGNLHMKIVLTMQQIARTEQLLAAARAELLAAARARKVIEKLREKQFRRWREEQERKDSALMDEIGTQTAVREALRLSLEEEEPGPEA